MHLISLEFFFVSIFWFPRRYLSLKNNADFVKFSRGLRPRTPIFFSNVQVADYYIFVYRWILAGPRVARGRFPKLNRWMCWSAETLYLYYTALWQYDCVKCFKIMRIHQDQKSRSLISKNFENFEQFDSKLESNWHWRKTRKWSFFYSV